MTRPVLNAVFQPQQWINDYAMDCASAFEFDAAPAVLSLNAEQIRHVVKEASASSGRDLDLLAEAANLVGAGDGQHDGPFCVRVDAMDLADFLFDVGVTDLQALTDDNLDRIRVDYCAAPSAANNG